MTVTAKTSGWTKALDEVVLLLATLGDLWLKSIGTGPRSTFSCR